MKEAWTAADASYYSVLCNIVLDCDSSQLSVQQPSLQSALHAFHTWHNDDVTCGCTTMSADWLSLYCQAVVD